MSLMEQAKRRAGKPQKKQPSKPKEDQTNSEISKLGPNVVIDIETTYPKDKWDTLMKHANRALETSARPPAWYTKGEEPPEEWFNLIKKQACLHPAFGRISAIGVMTAEEEDRKYNIFIHEDELQLLKDFSTFNLQNNTRTWITYNGIKFDVPFLDLRLQLNGLPSSYIDKARWSARNHIDLYSVLSNFQQDNPRNIKMDIDAVSEMMGLEVPPECGNSFEMPEMFWANDFDGIRLHLAADLVAAANLWNRMGKPIAK